MHEFQTCHVYIVRNTGGPTRRVMSGRMTARHESHYGSYIMDITVVSEGRPGIWVSTCRYQPLDSHYIVTFHSATNLVVEIDKLKYVIRLIV
jgi:hypothetical protein